MDRKEYQRVVTEAALLVRNAPDEARGLLEQAQGLHRRVEAARFLRWPFLNAQRFRRELAPLQRTCNETARLCHRVRRIQQTLEAWKNLPGWVVGPQRSQFAVRIDSIPKRAAEVCGRISCEADMFEADQAILQIGRDADSLTCFLAALGEVYADLAKLGRSGTVQHLNALNELQRRWGADGPDVAWEAAIASIRAQISAERSRTEDRLHVDAAASLHDRSREAGA
jgi:hypothetical protein